MGAIAEKWKKKNWKPSKVEPIKTKPKKEINYQSYWDLVGATSHYEFENKLRELIFDREGREEFYKNMIDIDWQLENDSFKPYFEIYSAERKTNQQDYTPDSVAKLLSVITRQDGDKNGQGKYTAYDMTAGTGTLLINKWWDDMLQETPWSYAPHRYFYLAEELADNSIPYLIHNLTMRGMNAIVIHGDALHRKAKQVYFIQNSKDDFMAFSDINVMPHNETTMKEFNIKEFTQDQIDHIESGEVVFNFALPSKAQKLDINTDPPKIRSAHPLEECNQIKGHSIRGKSEERENVSQGVDSDPIECDEGTVRLARIRWGSS